MNWEIFVVCFVCISFICFLEEGGAEIITKEKFWPNICVNGFFVERVRVVVVVVFVFGSEFEGRSIEKNQTQISADLITLQWDKTKYVIEWCLFRIYKKFWKSRNLTWILYSPISRKRLDAIFVIQVYFKLQSFSFPPIWPGLTYLKFLISED